MEAARDSDTGQRAAQPTPPPPPQTPAPPAALAGPPGPGPLDESHFDLIRQAVVNRRAVKAASRTALASAATTLGIGALSLPFVLFSPSWDAAMVVAGVCAVGVVEYVGYRRMRQAQPSAARFLSRNQLAFLALIVAYCLIQIFTFSTEQAKAAALSPEVRRLLGDLPGMARSINATIDRWAPIFVWGFYFLIIVLSICFQGGMAWYYHTRRRHIESFNQSTPAWVRRLFIEIGA